MVGIVVTVQKHIASQIVVSIVVSSSCFSHYSLCVRELNGCSSRQDCHEVSGEVSAILMRVWVFVHYSRGRRHQEVCVASWSWHFEEPPIAPGVDLCAVQFRHRFFLGMASDDFVDVR